MRKAKFMIIKPLNFISKKTCFFLSFCFFLSSMQLNAQEKKQDSDFLLNFRSTLFSKETFLERENVIDASKFLNPSINPFKYSNFELKLLLGNSQGLSFVSDIFYFFDLDGFLKLNTFNFESFEIKNSYVELNSDFLPTLWLGYKAITRRHMSLFSTPSFMSLYLFGGGSHFNDWSLNFGIANEVNTERNFVENSYHVFEDKEFSEHRFKKPVYQFNLLKKIFLPHGDIIVPHIGVNLFQSKTVGDSSKVGKGFFDDRIGGTIDFLYSRPFGIINTGETTFFLAIVPVQQMTSNTQSLIPVMLSSRGEKKEVLNIFGVEDSSKWNITKDFALFTGLNFKSYSYKNNLKDDKNINEDKTINGYISSLYFKVQPEYSYQRLYFGFSLGAYYISKSLYADDKDFLLLNPYLKYFPKELFFLESLFVSLSYKKYNFLRESLFSINKDSSSLFLSLGFNVDISSKLF